MSSSQTGAEIERYVSEDEWQYRENINIAKNSVDLTLVFNRHASAEDAEAATEFVEPDSLVFVELVDTNAQDSGIRGVLMLLNKLRIIYGKTSEQYDKYKQQLLEALRQDELQLGSGLVPADSSAHMLREAILLVEKDCIVFVGDLYLPANDEKFSELRATTERDNSAAYPSLVLGDAAKRRSPLGRIIKDAYAQDQAYNRFHQLREQFFSGNALGTAGAYIKVANNESLSRTADGKVRMYGIFGTAHAHSLTGNFANLGVEASRIIVRELPTGHYIETYEKINSNKNRRLGFRALSALIFAHFTESALESIQEELYESLERLNGDESETQRLLIAITQSSLLLEADPDRSYGYLKSILREYLPEPAHFV